MPKHVDAVPALDNFRAPWETEAGEDAEIDKPKLKRYIHGLQVDKAKAQDAREEAKEAQSAAETKAAAEKKRADDASGTETAAALTKAEKERDEAREEVKALKAEKAQADLKASVIGDLDPKYAKYVTGETEQELKDSLKQVREDFDLPDPADKSKDDDDEDDDDDDDDRPSLRRQPRLTNGRPKDDSDDSNFDVDKIAAQIVDGQGFGIFA